MPIALLYHDLVPAGRDDDSGFSGPGAARYKITPQEFDAHLAALHEAATSPPARLLPLPSCPKTWSITFDDGGISSLEIADALEARGWRGWFFMTTDRINAPAFLSSAQLSDLHRRGHRIGTHSCSHPARMSYCSRVQLDEEWRRSRARLEDVLGSEVTCGSVPGGFYSHDVAASAAAAGLTLLFNSEPVTRLGQVDGCTIIGRYTLYRGMPATTAASLLRSRFARARQSSLWSAKKLAKTCGGTLYLNLRERFWRQAYAAPATAGQ